MAKKGKKSRRAKLHRSCGAMAAHMMLLERYPAFRANQMRLEGATDRRRDSEIDLKARRRSSPSRRSSTSSTRRPSRTSRRRRSTARSRRSTRTSAPPTPTRAQTPAPWNGLVTDSRIQFKLVKVTRTKTTEDDFTHDDGVKKASTGGIAPFKPKTHLNIWVCPLRGGLLGYAQFPGGPQSTDGVVINYQAFGTIGTAQPPFNKGRTATHEIGHYFNLRHIWGDTPDCSGSDMVPDTPNCAGPNTGMPAFPTITCNNGPNGDMFMNYMDYTDDAGMFMFTTQQVLRMRTALETERSGLK